MALASENIRLVIIGAGWQGSEIQSYLHDLAAQGTVVDFLGYIDEFKTGLWNNVPILGGWAELASLAASDLKKPLYYLTATGNNRVRAGFVWRLDQMSNARPWTLLHPRACVGQNVMIQEGACLAPGSIITTNSKIGRHSILNVKASVSHDCEIGDFVNLNPGATIAGNVRLGAGVYIGAGATVIDKVSVGANTIIGAGAVVVHDIPPDVTAVGVPARVIKRH